jgi:predicted PurR-regulated permease PerM
MAADIEDREPLARTALPPSGETGAEGPPSAEAGETSVPAATSIQSILLGLGLIGFLYFARPVVLPVFLACMATMALKPVMKWLTSLRIPTAISAAIIFVLLVVALAFGFAELGRPAIRWIDDVPEHIEDLRGRVQKFFPNAARMGAAMAAVTDLGESSVKKKSEPQQVPTVEIKDPNGASSVLNWTGTALAGLGEVLVLIYLLLASGDLFMQKLVRLMPTLRDKKRAIEVSHEIQSNISNYLAVVFITNISVGAVASVCFYFLSVPGAAMWGMLVAILNFVPYFGPIVGVGLLAVVGLLTFDTLPAALLPAGSYLALHLLESNIVTPQLLGRRFTLNPVAVFISLMFWLWLWGVPGALLSVPILVSIKAICDRIPGALYISELIGR